MGWILGYLAEQHKLLRAELKRSSLARELHGGVLLKLAKSSALPVVFATRCRVSRW